MVSGEVAGRTPTVDPTAWVAPGAIVVGDVTLGAGSSVWYGAVLRGDEEAVVVGARVNVQDGCVLHSDPGFPCVLADDVSLGHRAVVHGARVEAGALIGIGAVVLNGAVVGAGALVAAGALVPPGAHVPPGALAAGVPAKVRRGVTDAEREDQLRRVHDYQARAAQHASARWSLTPGE